MPLVFAARYTRREIRANRRKLYVFGDNMVRLGFGGQAREARGESNAVGIPTKHYPGIDEGAYFTDADLVAVAARFEKAFERIRTHLRGGHVVVWPADGIGTGLAQLERRAPAIWADLQARLAAIRDVGGRGE